MRFLFAGVRAVWVVRPVSVDLEALAEAANGLTRTVQQFHAEDVADLLPEAGDVGSEDLAAALGEFDERWERGVNHLSRDVEEVAGRVGEALTTYVEAEAGVVERMAGLLEAIHQVEGETDLAGGDAG